jgi:GNAT superfamily N-acetyltransferase
MSDMLVRLYDLPPLPAAVGAGDSGIRIRRAMAYELLPVTRWVSATFGIGWEGECAVCFARQPISCFIALKDDRIVGFACYETTFRGYFGPTGVEEAQRGQGIGTRLLLACLHDMRNIGYGYAIIGGAGPADYYRKTVGAVPIEGSEPGMYPPWLKSEDPPST